MLDFMLTFSFHPNLAFFLKVQQIKTQIQNKARTYEHFFINYNYT
jgi:hypothetical protein